MCSIQAGREVQGTSPTRIEGTVLEKCGIFAQPSCCCCRGTLIIYVARLVQVYVIHSWTKIWSCAGIRLGSFVAPTIDEYEKVKSHQVCDVWEEVGQKHRKCTIGFVVSSPAAQHPWSVKRQPTTDGSHPRRI